MLAIVLVNLSFLKLTARPPPRAMSAALWLANMPQGAEFAAFAHPPGIVYCWELPAHAADGTPLDLRPLLSYYTARPAAPLADALARGRGEHAGRCAADDVRCLSFLTLTRTLTPTRTPTRTPTLTLTLTRCAPCAGSTTFSTRSTPS